MYLKITKVLIILFYLKQVFGQTLNFCRQKKFDSIHTNEIFKEGKNAFSIIDVITGDKLFRWNLKTNAFINETLKEPFVRIFIPTLSPCNSSGGDCQELHKLSNTAITFGLKISTYSYEITKFVKTHKEEDCTHCDLPWNMSSKGNPISEHNLWPKNWINGKKPVAAYDPLSNQLIFVFNPKDSLDDIKVMRNSLNSNNWTQTWEMDELKGVKYFYIGLVTLMAINGTTGQPYRKNMNRIFAFSLRTDEFHEVYEYIDKKFIKSDYDYKSLFQCPKVVVEDSNLALYVLVGVVIIAIVVVFLIIGLVVCFCGQRDGKTTKFNIRSSSSGGFGSKSSDSFTDSKKEKRSRFS